MPAHHKPLILGFLASHGGSNLQAILDSVAGGALPASVGVVISNNSGSMALERARNFGSAALHISRATHETPESEDAAIATALQSHGANLLVLAGYMRKIGPCVLAAYPRRIINVHPALLPKFGGRGMFGLHVHEAVLAAGDRETGVTVHLVDDVYDHGAVIAQATVPVESGDTPESLQARVLKTEHLLFPDTLRRIATGEINLDSL